MKPIASIAKYRNTLYVLGAILLVIGDGQAGCTRSVKRDRTVTAPDVRASSNESLSGSEMGGRPVPPPPLGPVSSSDLDLVLRRGEADRVFVGAMMPDDSQSGSYMTQISIYGYPRKGPFLTHLLDVQSVEYSQPGREVKYSFEAKYQKEFSELLKLIQERKLLGLALKRDVDGGPDRYALSITIIGYPDLDNWCEKQKKPEPGYSVAPFQCPVVREKTSTFRTNTKAPLSKANADFTELMDFIRQKFIQYALDNYGSLEEYRGAETVRRESRPGAS